MDEQVSQRKVKKFHDKKIPTAAAEASPENIISLRLHNFN